jgi:hypothetical protein
MNRLLLTGFVALSMIGSGAAVAAPSAKTPRVQQATNQVNVGQLSGSLVEAARRLPATSVENDYLQVFLAEISSSGAPQVVVLSAIDKAVGVAGLPKGAIQALEALRKRSRHMDHTAALTNDTSGGPALASGGGSDYTR